MTRSVLSARADRRRFAWRTRREPCTVRDAIGPVPVLGSLGVAFVDALLAYEEEHERPPSWEELASLLDCSSPVARDRASILRGVGVVTWTDGKPRTLAVVGRYREGAK